MRVVSGRFEGMVLATPKAGTRPTMDRTKEAIFSHLDSWGMLDSARVLDLFAGTGTLGIEALSRGARELVAVEGSRPAAAPITKALAQLQKGRSRDASLKAHMLVRKAEQAADGFGEPFDVILINPPYVYGTARCNQLLSDLAAGSTTNENTVIMLEHSVRPDDPTTPRDWQVTESHNYGETAIFYIESVDDSSDIGRSDDFTA